MNRTMTPEMIAAYKEYLLQEERAANTITRYMHDVHAFAAWIGAQEVTKDTIVAWKDHLYHQKGHSAGTINSALASLHSFFHFAGWTECRVKYLKMQRKMFRESAKELTKEEYFRLVETAEKQGNHRLELLLETICATGVRVSEVQYITVEAVCAGRADIALKGKIRTVLIPDRLSVKLLQYAENRNIVSGEIFITESGKGISRRQIWGEMKRLCSAAGVDESKVYPHNLRHLFARSYYTACKDIVKLADVLGHSSVETTRIYLITTGYEHRKELDGLGLVS